MKTEERLNKRGSKKAEDEQLAKIDEKMVMTMGRVAASHGHLLGQNKVQGLLRQRRGFC